MLNTKQKPDWHGRKCLPSLLSFLKTLTLSMTFSSSPSDAVNRPKRTEMSSLLRYIYKWGFSRTVYANFITIKSNKTLRFYPKIVYDSIYLFTIIQIHPFFLFLLLYISFMHSGANNSPFSLSRPIILPISLVPRL